ncbi:unnamed protein product, partial [Iphiclides podalirius]
MIKRSQARLTREEVDLVKTQYRFDDPGSICVSDDSIAGFRHVSLCVRATYGRARVLLQTKAIGRARTRAQARGEMNSPTPAVPPTRFI